MDKKTRLKEMKLITDMISDVYFDLPIRFTYWREESFLKIPNTINKLRCDFNINNYDFEESNKTIEKRKLELFDEAIFPPFWLSYKSYHTDCLYRERSMYLQKVQQIKIIINKLMLFDKSGYVLKTPIINTVYSDMIHQPGTHNIKTKGFIMAKIEQIYEFYDLFLWRRYPYTEILKLAPSREKVFSDIPAAIKSIKIDFNICNFHFEEKSNIYLKYKYRKVLGRVSNVIELLTIWENNFIKH